MALRTYRPASYPQIEAGQATYLTSEFDNIAQALAPLTTLAADVATIKATLAAPRVSFSAHKNGTGQVLSNVGTDQKVTFTSKAFDVGGFYDATNSKWVPPAGLVQLVAQVFVGSATDQVQYHISLYKNGSLLKVGNVLGASGALNVSPGVTVIDLATGTDFYEVFIAMSDAVAKTVSGAVAFTYFQGSVL